MRQNATSWHGVMPGPEEGFHGHAGHADALVVIAKWCDEALGDTNPASEPKP